MFGLLLLATVLFAVTPDPTHVAAELANCYAQHRPECPTPIPTSTPTLTPLPTPSATPSPTETLVPQLPAAFVQSGIPEGSARRPAPTIEEAAPTETPAPLVVVAVPPTATPRIVVQPPPQPRVVIQQETVVVVQTVIVVATAEPTRASTPTLTPTPRPSPTPSSKPSPRPTVARSPSGTPTVLALGPLRVPPGGPVSHPGPPVNWDWGGFFRGVGIVLGAVLIVVFVFTRRRVVVWRTRGHGGPSDA